MVGNAVLTFKAWGRNGYRKADPQLAARRRGAGHFWRLYGAGQWQRFWSALRPQPAARSGRLQLLTADKGFVAIWLYPPGSLGGILLLRPDEDGIRPVLDLLKAVLVEVDLAELEGVVAVATSQGLRVRRR